MKDNQSTLKSSIMLSIANSDFISYYSHPTSNIHHPIPVTRPDTRCPAPDTVKMLLAGQGQSWMILIFSTTPCLVGIVRRRRNQTPNDQHHPLRRSETTSTLSSVCDAFPRKTKSSMAVGFLEGIRRYVMLSSRLREVTLYDLVQQWFGRGEKGGGG